MVRAMTSATRPRAGWAHGGVVAVVGCLLALLLGAVPAGAAEPPAFDLEPLETLGATKAKEVNPCMTPDPGFGIYDKWSRNISMGQMIAPQKGGLTSSGGFDLIVHFHGHYPIRKEFVKTAKGVVLVAIDLGIGSGAYYQAFAGPQTFERLLESVKQEMARRSGRDKVHIRNLALSSWSAGYGAVSQILTQPAGKKVDTLILLDSVHAGYVDEKAKKLKTEQIKPFLEFARKAARGKGLMFQSHSSIIPPGYAPTREVSHYIVEQLGGKMRKSTRSDVLGLSMFERYDRGNYHVRGYRGNDKPDHCAHLGLMADVVKIHINRRWNPPAGSRGKAEIRQDRIAAKKDGRIHTVVKGDTLSGIAAKYGVTTTALRAANNLAKGKPIRLGQELIVPDGGNAPASSAKDGSKDAPATPKPGEKVHTVAKGQSLGAIAKRYRVTVDQIRERNDLDVGGRKIQPGDKLIIPKPKAKRAEKKPSDDPKLRPGERIHRVHKGQSLGAIAKRYHVTVDAIRERNDLKKGGRKIQPGDDLVIPAK
jgi:LysM repeat protein